MCTYARIGVKGILVRLVRLVCRWAACAPTSASGTLASAHPGWRPKNPVKVDDEAARGEVEGFLAAIDEDDDVQNLYVGLA